MFWCNGGGHPILDNDSIVVGTARYCSEHLPEPDYKPTARELGRMGFVKWRAQRGDFHDDDHGEELTDAEKARLARHVLP
jgi:hypothetical protein